MRKIIYFISALFILSSCGQQMKSDKLSNNDKMIMTPKYSLAQWSFNRELFSGEMTTFDFIRIAGELEFDGVEYVSTFFLDKVENFEFLDSLKVAARTADVKNLLIMVDGAGDLGARDSQERENSIESHKKWVKAAKYIGCSSIRVNAHGEGTPSEIREACIDGVGRLAKWAKTQGIDIIIENHGGVSNDGAWLASLVKELQQFGVGTLPDFDNWCIERENGELWGAPCIKEYDRYTGLADLMPYAKSLSVKSFDFDENGNETSMDYKRLFEIVQKANYQGYLGLEFEGDKLQSIEGIKKTRALVERVLQDD